jgi:hypothetical protein
MKLLEGEATISEAIEHLTLTTHRVRYDERASGATRIVSITLDAVSSCGIVSKSHPILLVLAVVAGLLGVLLLNSDMGEGNVRTGLFLAAVALAIAYLATRTVALAISSSGESIMVAASGVVPDVLIGFIDAVEQAKLKYLDRATG